MVAPARGVRLGSVRQRVWGVVCVGAGRCVVGWLVRWSVPVLFIVLHEEAECLHGDGVGF